MVFGSTTGLPSLPCRSTQIFLVSGFFSSAATLVTTNTAVSPAVTLNDTHDIWDFDVDGDGVKTNDITPEVDPDAEGVAGISGTKMRNHATNNDYKSFKAGLHANHNDEQAKKLFKATRQGMNLQKEERGMKDFATFLTEDMEGMSQKSGDKRSTESGAGMTACLLYTSDAADE